MMKKILIKVLLPVFVLLAVTEARAEKGAIHARIPEGLYLYQPSMKHYGWAALFAVRDGTLVDPYQKYAASARAFVEVMSEEEKGILAALNKGYAAEGGYAVYRGREAAGTLDGVKLRIVRQCYSGKMLSDIIADGRYTEDPGYSKNTGALYTSDNAFEDFALLKGIAVPGGMPGFKTGKGFAVSEADRVMALKAAREGLYGEAMRRIKKDLRHLHNGKLDIVSPGGKDGLESLRAIDIDGDGVKDLIGIYSIHVGYRHVNAGDTDAHAAVYSKETLFTVFGTGKAEAVAFGEYIGPAFSLGGMIDIDRDGALELVVQASVAESDGEEGSYDEGRRVEVFRHGQRGWVKVYGTKGICGCFN